MKRGRGRPPASKESTTATPVRQSRRLVSAPNIAKSASTPQTSKYFEHSSSSSQSGDIGDDRETESVYEADDISVPSVSESDVSSKDISDEDVGPRKRRQIQKTTKTAEKPDYRQAATGTELWRAGVKSELAPGKEIFIKLPKARQAGKTPYSDATIHPNTLLFLADLKMNNDREWLKIHDADYRQAQQDFGSFVEKLTHKLIERDTTLPELPSKDIIFRIYRDVRFSKDPTPYKTHFSAAAVKDLTQPIIFKSLQGPVFVREVLPLGVRACLLVEDSTMYTFLPSSYIVGGGLWQPEAPYLSLLRQDVDRRPHRIKEVLLQAGIRDRFFTGAPNDEAKVVDSFVGQNSGNALKRKPKGYTDDNPNVDILRLKNYTIGRKLKDDDALGSHSLSLISEMLGSLTPFITYLNSVVMPDEQYASDESPETGTPTSE